MQELKNRSSRRTACVALIAFCGACNALLDNHSRDLEVVAPAAGGTSMASLGAAGEGGSDAAEAGMGGASGDGNQSSEGGTAGEHEPPGNQAGSPTGGTAGTSHGGTSSQGGTSSHGGTSQGGMPACTACKPGATEPQTRSCGVCNAGKESGTKSCTSSCTWVTSWSGVCSDHGNSENGCSFVKWCKNDAGRPECSLVGCTSKEAEDECREEAQNVCGTTKNLVINTQCP